MGPNWTDLVPRIGDEEVDEWGAGGGVWITLLSSQLNNFIFSYDRDRKKEIERRSGIRRK